jgi:hypothetical protein
LNYKIILSKTTSAIFLAVVLLAGTIALSYPSFMIDVQAQPYYYDSGSDNSYNSYGPPDYPSYKLDYKAKYSSDNNNYKSKESSKSVISINKIKCINTNLNINGNNAGNISIGNKGQGYLGAYSSDGGSDGGYGGSEGYSKQGKGSDCIINNNNTNIGGAGNQTIPPEQPKGTLNIIKNVTCTYTIGGLDPFQACELLKQRITENQFLIKVTNDNPIPSQFPGSESGTIVTLGAGNYVVSETPDVTAIQIDIAFLVNEFKILSGGTYNISYPPQVTFSGDCAPSGTGTIGAGESQTCNIENHFTITAILS